MSIIYHQESTRHSLWHGTSGSMAKACPWLPLRILLAPSMHPALWPKWALRHFPHAPLTPMFVSPPNSAFHITPIIPDPALWCPLVVFAWLPPAWRTWNTGFVTSEDSTLAFSKYEALASSSHLSEPLQASRDRRSYLIILHRIYSINACWMNVSSVLSSAFWYNTFSWSQQKKVPVT